MNLVPKLSLTFIAGVSLVLVNHFPLRRDLVRSELCVAHARAYRRVHAPGQPACRELSRGFWLALCRRISRAPCRRAGHALWPAPLPGLFRPISRAPGFLISHALSLSLCLPT